MRVTQNLDLISRLDELAYVPPNVLHYVHKSENQTLEDICETQRDVLEKHRTHKLNMALNVRND